MEQLQTSAQSLGIALNQAQLEHFSRYFEELVIWNNSFNLTTIIEKDAVIAKHFLDSLTIVPYIPSSARTLLDIGTGAGFPGIPAKIVRTDLEVTLLEAISKKVSFLEHIILMLSLEQIKAVQGRAEDFGHDASYREKFDVVTARAVAHLSVLAEYTLPFLKIGGLCIAQKTANSEEVTEAETALKELGGKIKEVIPVIVQGLENRSIVIIEKISPTPEKYPRRAGVPSKRPL